MSPHRVTLEKQHRAWWKESSVYQIYPASFKDSTNNGVGDLAGIYSKLDHMKQLGIDVVWLCPIFKSPQIDMGYDISDYMTIDPQYGDISDVDNITAGLHERGMKILMDLVVNHTSDQHEWFKQSRSSKDNEFRDWYVWKKPKYDAEGNRLPPNNWTAHFQGSAWEWDELSQEYYLHLFCPEQPDLNWEHPPVRAAVHAIMRFWLDRGIDGFRMDVINYISKDQAFPDGDTSLSHWCGNEHYSAGPRLHEYLKDLGSILKEYNAFNVGEMPCVNDPKQVINSVQHQRGELNMIFHFELHNVDHGPSGKFSPREWPLRKLKDIVEKWQSFMYNNGGWNALYLENHDQPRSVSRYTNATPENYQAAAKMLATFLGFQAGTVFVYQGQELGMTNVPTEWGMEEYKDVDCVNHWNVLNASTTDPTILSVAKAESQKKSRDNARTPMQWDSSANAGFTSPSTKPWMSVNPNYATINAESQVSDPHSVFSYWASVLAARKKHKDVFVYGKFELVDRENENVFAYTMQAEDGHVALVLCNFSQDKVTFPLSQEVTNVILSTHGRGVGDFKTGAVLEPYEACSVLI